MRSVLRRFVAAALVGLAGFGTGLSRAQTFPARNAFEKVGASLVIITTPTETGSGCIVALNGHKYLMTNEHVTRGGLPLQARLLNGTTLQLGDIMLAPDRDLAMFEISDDAIPAINPLAGEPRMDEFITVCGNSDGAGVATTIRGRVIGIGPDRIEVDAPFVAGNSGSPILSANGDLVAIASYALRVPDPSDWAKAGTRFTEVRRFGLRVTNIQWVTMTMPDYLARSESLEDLRSCCMELYKVIVSPQYDGGGRKATFRRHKVFDDLLRDVAQAKQDVVKWKDSTSVMRDNAVDKLSRRLGDVYKTGMRLVQNPNWQVERFQKDAEYLGEVLHVFTSVGDQLKAETAKTLNGSRPTPSAGSAVTRGEEMQVVIRQIVPGGALATPYDLVSVTTAPGQVRLFKQLRDTVVFLQDAPSTLVDNAEWKGRVVESGVYRFQGLDGTRRTVRKYTIIR